MFEKCQGNTVASKYLWLQKTIVLPQLLCNNQPRRPWWHWTGNQMPLHDGKCSACPTLGKGSKGVDDLIWFLKNSKRLVIVIKIVHAIVVTKMTSKTHSKLTFSVWKWPFRRCQQPKALLYCLWREGKKIGNKKGVFVWVPDVFSAKKRRKKIATSDNQTYLRTSEKVQNSLQMHRNSFLVQEEVIHAKRKRTEQFDSELLVQWTKFLQKIPGKQQSNVPLALPEDWEVLFLVVALDSNREKKERKRRERNKTHVSVVILF